MIQYCESNRDVISKFSRKIKMADEQPSLQPEDFRRLQQRQIQVNELCTHAYMHVYNVIVHCYMRVSADVIF